MIKRVLSQQGIEIEPQLGEGKRVLEQEDGRNNRSSSCSAVSILQMAKVLSHTQLRTSDSLVQIVLDIVTTTPPLCGGCAEFQPCGWGSSFQKWSSAESNELWNCILKDRLMKPLEEILLRLRGMPTSHLHHQSYVEGWHLWLKWLKHENSTMLRKPSWRAMMKVQGWGLWGLSLEQAAIQHWLERPTELWVGTVRKTTTLGVCKFGNQMDTLCRVAAPREATTQTWHSIPINNRS